MTADKWRPKRHFYDTQWQISGGNQQRSSTASHHHQNHFCLNIKEIQQQTLSVFCLDDYQLFFLFHLDSYRVDHWSFTSSYCVVGIIHNWHNLSPDWLQTITVFTFHFHLMNYFILHFVGGLQRSKVFVLKPLFLQ